MGLYIPKPINWRRMFYLGAHDRDRTGEPLPYQGSALPTELRGLSRVQPTRGLKKVHIVKGMRDHLDLTDPPAGIYLASQTQRM